MHQIFGDRFFSHRIPAWHHLGRVLDGDYTAKEAFDLAGYYKVELQRLVTENGIMTDRKAILRYPTVEDPVYRIMGLVTKEYELITPYEAAQIFDDYVKRPVETLGVLRNGSVLFISTKLPGLDLFGDEIETYLLLVSPMTERASFQVYVTSDRVVCQNTLVLAIKNAVDRLRFRHIGEVKTRIGKELEDIYAKAVQQVTIQTDVFNILASTPINESKAIEHLDTIYKPLVINHNSANGSSLKVERFRQMSLMRRKEAALELFNGAGTGMEGRSTRGTAFGLLQSVTEVEDVRAGNNDYDRNIDIIFGQRAKYKREAYELLSGTYVRR